MLIQCVYVCADIYFKEREPKRPDNLFAGKDVETSAPIAFDQYWKMETSELNPMELRNMVSSGLWRREDVLGENIGSTTWSSAPKAGCSVVTPPLLLLLPLPLPTPGWGDGDERRTEFLPRMMVGREPSTSLLLGFLCLRMGVSVRYLSEAKKPKRDEVDVAVGVGVTLPLDASTLSKSSTTFLSPLVPLAWKRRERVLVSTEDPSPSPGVGDGVGLVPIVKPLLVVVL